MAICEACPETYDGLMLNPRSRDDDSFPRPALSRGGVGIARLTGNRERRVVSSQPDGGPVPSASLETQRGSCSWT